jgi:hypothetical protein
MKKSQNMHVWLRKENGIWLSIIVPSLWWLVKGAAAMMCTCRKECNKYDWSIIMIGSSGLLLVVPHLFCCPSFSFMGGVAKEHITKTWM